MSDTPITDRFMSQFYSKHGHLRRHPELDEIAMALGKFERDRAELAAALTLCLERMPTNDPMYSGQLKDAYEAARAALAKVAK